MEMSGNFTLSGGFIDYSYHGLFVPCMDHLYHGLFVPWHGPFVLWTIRTIHYFDNICCIIKSERARSNRLVSESKTSYFQTVVKLIFIHQIRFVCLLNFQVFCDFRT